MRVIEKKILSEYFDQIENGQKTYELRLADWECHPGDILVLNEIDSVTKKNTGRTLRRKVGFVAKTKELSFWSEQEIAEHGYQIISLIDEAEQ